jgi:hypothetical protein
MRDGAVMKKQGPERGKNGGTKNNAMRAEDFQSGNPCQKTPKAEPTTEERTA